jgi:hypothetical protein
VAFGHRFSWEISWLAAEGITTGYADGTFKPGRAVSRGAMAAYLHRLAGAPTVATPASPTFRDVKTNHPFFEEIEWHAAQAITTGYSDGTFKPGRAVSRGAMAAYLYRFAGSPGETTERFFDDVGPNHPFSGEIGWAANVGLVQGYLDWDTESWTYRPAAAGHPPGHGRVPLPAHRPRARRRDLTAKRNGRRRQQQATPCPHFRRLRSGSISGGLARGGAGRGTQWPDVPTTETR